MRRWYVGLPTSRCHVHPRPVGGPFSAGTHGQLSPHDVPARNSAIADSNLALKAEQSLGKEAGLRAATPERHGAVTVSESRWLTGGRHARRRPDRDRPRAGNAGSGAVEGRGVRPSRPQRLAANAGDGGDLDRTPFYASLGKIVGLDTVNPFIDRLACIRGTRQRRDGRLRGRGRRHGNCARSSGGGTIDHVPEDFPAQSTRRTFSSRLRGGLRSGRQRCATCSTPAPARWTSSSAASSSRTLPGESIPVRCAHT